ncbi:MAG: N-acetylmuramoyl-L-alanine amidase [Verrucomicrobiales bacterium]|nr:N-acetylmuramoyl-L-alanine amidase [Verrucomicrobiales bacterium]
MKLLSALPFRLSFRAWLALLIIVPVIPAPALAEWRTKTINERSYVPLADFAAAFAMTKGNRRSGNGEIAFAGEAHRLVVKTDTREALVDGVRHWLSYPVVTRFGNPFVSLADINATLGPAMSPSSVKAIKPVKTVVFDPGHGGHDKGGRGPYGNEKDYALDVVKRARRILESKGVKVVQSRLSDVFIELHERPKMNKNYESPVFVSVHFNSAGWKPSANGIEVYALPSAGLPTTGKAPDPILDRRKDAGNAIVPASFVFANTMQHTLLGKMSESFDRGVKRARYVVLRYSDVPSILIEGGFVTNPEETKKIHSPEWREKYASAVADGILAYMALANEQRLPKRAWDYGREGSDEFVWEE